MREIRLREKALRIPDRPRIETRVRPAAASASPLHQKALAPEVTALTTAVRREGNMKALLLAFAFAAVFAGSTASAQSYPSRPVTIVVPFSAGGPTDTLARIMGERMRKTLGQPVVIDNTTGAGGSIGTAKVVRAAPDGYMVSIGHWGTHVVNGVYYTLPFSVLTDFEPVAMVASNPQVIVSKLALPATNLKQLMVWISTNHGKVLM